MPDANENALPAKLAETQPPVCGVIMPISATAPGRDEARWRDVQILLHRAIGNAGLLPKNVWENAAADRVSNRIIGNIFHAEVVVADVTDLNANVMLELGLRLASKKPTVVIISSGCTIPFDIRDYYVAHYPSDLNILGMEKFIEELAGLLREVYAAHKVGKYDPFLGDIVIDVIAPGERRITPESALLEAMQALQNRLEVIEDRTTGLGPRPPQDPPQARQWHTINADGVREPLYLIPKNKAAVTLRDLTEIENVEGVRAVGGGRNSLYVAIKFKAQLSDDQSIAVEAAVDAAVEARGGECGLPAQAVLDPLLV